MAMEIPTSRKEGESSDDRIILRNQFRCICWKAWPRVDVDKENDEADCQRKYPKAGQGVQTDLRYDGHGGEAFCREEGSETTVLIGVKA